MREWPSVDFEAGQHRTDALRPDLHRPGLIRDIGHHLKGYPQAAVAGECKAVQAEVGWSLRSAQKIEEVAAPTSEELRLIREEVDPHAMYR